MNGERILIAEDQTLMAEGLRKLIECEFSTVSIVENGEALLRAVTTFRPHVVLMDIGMRTPNGIDAARRVRSLAPEAKIIILTGHDQAEYVVEAFRVGAVGYLLKRCDVSELVAAIREVLSGNPYITPQVSQGPIASPGTPGSRMRASLTVRQLEVLRLIAEGLTAKEIANLLHLSAKTAVFHKMAIMDKLGVRTTAELTRYAVEHGIVASKFIPIALSVPCAEASELVTNQPESALMPRLMTAAQ